MATKATAEPQPVMVALTSFVGIDGSPIRKGDTFPADDPAVRKWPSLFAAVVARRTSGPIIEQATAAPGEKRGA